MEKLGKNYPKRNNFVTSGYMIIDDMNDLLCTHLLNISVLELRELASGLNKMCHFSLREAFKNKPKWLRSCVSRAGGVNTKSTLSKSVDFQG